MIKAKVYLKIIFSSLNEIKYIKMSLQESIGYVDYVLVTECNRSHVGTEHKYLFMDILENSDTFSEEEKARIIYVKGNLDGQVYENAENKEEMHQNETLIRGFFVKEIKLKPWDIIVAVDADEVIYRRYWPEILSHFKWYDINPALILELNTFFYRPTWLWEDCNFKAPTACRVWRYWYKYPANWRYDGKKLGHTVGGHFSWQLTTEEMLHKLKSYAHSAEYGQFAEENILKEAVREKKYPFNPLVSFSIKELDITRDSHLFPDNMREYIDWFEYLLEEDQHE